MYMLYVMRRFNPPKEQLVKVYTTYIRPLLEYCAPVFHAGLTANQAQQLERCQKRALKIIAGYDYTYRELLDKFDLENLADRREKMCLRLGKQMLKNPTHREMFPPTREAISGRCTRKYEEVSTFLLQCKTTKIDGSAHDDVAERGCMLSVVNRTQQASE